MNGWYERYIEEKREVDRLKHDLVIQIRIQQGGLAAMEQELANLDALLDSIGKKYQDHIDGLNKL